VLGDVEETIFVAEEDEEDQEPRVRTVKKQSEMLFVRGMPTSIQGVIGEERANNTLEGDSVVLIAPAEGTS